MSHEIGPIDDAFLRALFAQDELGAVVRAHILIEGQVNGIVEHLLVDPKSLPRLRFEQTVRLMVALGASDELSEPLIELGRIRNAFGHRPDTHLTMAMIDKWISYFSESDRALMNKALEKTRVDLGQPPAKLDEHDPKSRFILASVFLRQVLRQMQSELNAKQAASRAPR